LNFKLAAVTRFIFTFYVKYGNAFADCSRKLLFTFPTGQLIPPLTYVADSGKGDFK